MQKVGIAFPEDLLAETDAAKPETTSRSQFVRERLVDGLVVHEFMDEVDVEFPSEQERRAFLRQALRDAAVEYGE